MIKNKNLFKNISLFFCLVPMLLLSLFCLIPKSNKMIVSADYSQPLYSFVGSNLYTFDFYYHKVLSTGNVSRGIWSTSAKFSFSADLNNKINVVPTIYRVEDNNSTGTISYTELFPINDSYQRITLPQIDVSTDYSNVFKFTQSDLLNYPNDKYFAQIGIIVDSGFDCQVKRISIHLKPVMLAINDSNCASFRIEYFDNEDRSLCFEFAVPSNTIWDDRNYYVGDSSSIDFENGYNDGLNDGYENGYNDGLLANQEVIFNSGYNAGYEYGIESANNYTFLSLIGAVIDAPISAFTSLLNFNLLGFNMLSFVTGLITLCLIIFIVKLILGGK